MTTAEHDVAGIELELLIVMVCWSTRPTVLVVNDNCVDEALISGARDPTLSSILFFGWQEMRPPKKRVRKLALKI